MAAFGIKNPKIVRRVIMSKLRMVLHARKMWPKYVNMKEDEMLRDPKWNGKYKGKRMVFWDTTGIKLNTPSDALLQRLTYSILCWQCSPGWYLCAAVWLAGDT